MRRLVVIAVVLVALGAGAEVAWSFITSTGSGAGTASTPTLITVSIDATSGTPLTALLPGSSGDATLELANPNATTLTLTSVVGAGTITVSNAPGCTSGNDGVTFTNQSALSVVVPAHATAFSVDLPGSVAMAASSASACQGATFSIPVTVTVQLG
jgi:hypothetical protein